MSEIPTWMIHGFPCDDGTISWEATCFGDKMVTQSEWGDTPLEAFNKLCENQINGVYDETL